MCAGIDILLPPMEFSTSPTDRGSRLIESSTTSPIHLHSENSYGAESQTSSFGESVTGQPSRFFSASHGVLDSPLPDFRTDVATPSTSLSNPSSQENQTADTSLNQAIASARTDGRIYRTSTPTSNLQNEIEPMTGSPYNGLKRTASGELKSGGPSVQTTPDSGKRGHSRNTSTTSRGSQIGELSNQLRTRLSYAMVKVQNGWQSRSLDELEILTSQQGSTASMPSPRQLPGSPRTSISTSRPSSSGIMESAERSTAPMAYMYPPNRMFNAGPTNNMHESAIRGQGSDQPGLSYEAFWREHSSTKSARYTSASSPPKQGPSLAPPFDLQPRNQRRYTPAQPQHPSLYTSNLRGMQHHSAGSPSSAMSITPATLSPNRLSVIRTPSQKAAMEKDAVETLLFMSSPGNSYYHAPTHKPSESLANQFSGPHKRADFAMTIDDQPTNRPTRASLLDLGKLHTEDDIDQLLDRMPDEDSSTDGEDLIIERRNAPLFTPR